MALTSSSTEANCGQTDGEACVAITGGTTPITQVWDDPSAQTTLCASNVASGNYEVIVTDANGCMDSVTVAVNDASGGTASITVDNNTSCDESCDGQATASMTGGTGPFTYLWDSGNNTTAQTSDGLCAGAINVSITDANGCVANASATITQPDTLTVNLTSTNVTCNAGTDGSVTATGVGGTSLVAYNFSWIDQATTANIGTTPSITDLPIGTYCVTITDDNNCSATDCITITEPDAIVVTTSVTDANCGQADGAIAVNNTTGGSGTYVTESWVDATPAAVADINAVSAGTYTVTVTDDQGCTGTAIATVSDLTGPAITVDNITMVSCNSACDGSAVISVTGGSSPYSYTWTPAPGSGQGTASIGALCAGSYGVTVSDANGCSASETIVITEPDVVANTVNSTADVSGFGICDGTADINVTGGDGNYTYTWFSDCGATTPEPTLTGTSVTGLCAGSYAIVTTDGNLCADTLCITINEPGAITSTLTSIDVTCFGDCDGTATITAGGGIPPFTYVWYNSPTDTLVGQTSTTATGLCAGDYYAIVTDANGITHTSQNVTVGTPTQVTASAAVISDYNGFSVSCASSCDGSAEVTPSGGTAPYSYDWGAVTGNQTTPIAVDLCATQYTVTVTDAAGCTTTADALLSKPPALVVDVTGSDVSCNGAEDGTVTSTVTGGVPPFTYQWDDPALSTTADISDLGPGTYTLTLTDANGCVESASATITQPTALSLTQSTIGSNCNQDDGSATVNAFGVGPFTYQWDANAGSQTTSVASNLFAGCYTVVVTDANGCQDSITPCVLDLGAPTATILTQQDASCNTGCDGFAQLDVQGGTAPLNYVWTEFK